MKLEDFRAQVPNELEQIAKEFHATKCYVFPKEVWSVVIEMRKTAWRKMWGMQYHER